MDEETLDYLLKKAEVELHEGAQIKSGVRALLEAMKGVVEYMQQYKKDLADGQAHQQSKERRRQERLAESEEGFENPYHGRCEDGQEVREVQSSEIYEIALAFAKLVSVKLGCIKYSAGGNLTSGERFKISIEFE